jgi:hypothetical protein
MRCPTCRRAIDDEAACPRCGTGLQELQAIRDAARRHLLRGRLALRQRRAAEAEQAFREAERLRHSATAARGIAVALLCQGRFAEALAVEVPGLQLGGKGGVRSGEDLFPPVTTSRASW